MEIEDMGNPDLSTGRILEIRRRLGIPRFVLGKTTRH